ncbi:hypothetical protein BASA50_002730 [Batrachochytrium salamandrivorans]|uniref:HECT-type E3 ubiquitin transferase n=1 Tax=Batrachochytrium salamandrivorans TaxID=1357716 RepID=A0ABQ8FKH2_9FUNG|nr:hypothetical protein BASA62_004696 [Batrachochytrium salamandrivorans]KAH6577667.1 hypothetical protein BASA60_003929 [Batrachochytrium salamandrivorans]KAH6583891.1 hypothetical protein BASA61_007801 [Batrachochytrium salamandrivorans]KAH6599859.1 hypothetical protein BASA50_002730 [Batrachochytrium salamandrivorans]KAH9248902.1 hypothetical protein BASA81_013414 [Batrachochytrium salamandrivorans]
MKKQALSSETPAPSTLSHDGFRTAVAAFLAADNVLGLRTLLYDTFSNASRLSTCLSLPHDDQAVGLVDLTELQTWYHTMTDQSDTTFASAITVVLDHLEHGIQNLKPGQTNIFLIIMECPVFLNADSLSIIMPKLCFILTTLTQHQQTEFAWVVQESIIKSSSSHGARSHFFQQLVGIVQQFITLRIVSNPNETLLASLDDATMWATQTLGILASINDTNAFIPYYEFYNESIEASIDLKEEYPKWKSREGPSFCNYPFVLSTSTKGDILKIESMVQMRHELQDAFFRAMFIGVNSPYLQIEVRRNYVIRDALFQLEGKSTHDLKKQLRISFFGEEGIDEGGVQKEFFQLVVRDMFNPSYGMFRYNEESRMCWFANLSTLRDKETLEEYTLMGRIIGLAIYNGVVLDIHFPLALYKKLLDINPDLDDLAELDPDLCRGLKQLLVFEGDIAETYGRTFTAEVESSIGARESIELHEGGALREVTAENRQEFVDLLVDFLINKSIGPAFQAFYEGFDFMMEGSALQLFRPEELQELICGSPSLDFYALEKVTQYDGYDKDTPVIRAFWHVVHEFTEEQKKLLLFFATGSDRVPVGGLSKLQFIIARNGTDSDRVPTSHTCYNVLLLCEYASVEKLRDRLLTALANCNCGFFLN